MKILAIRGKNIASLEGEFSIDFTQEPLCSAGIFSINGPTGSGKSTLLDVICLALFAQTPRGLQAKEQKVALQEMGKSLSQSDARNLLRRGTVSGYAEVDFLALDGHSYRSRWSVRRARDREEGALQDYELQLTDLTTGLPVQGKRGELANRIVQCTGLSFEQFTRTVLLAQNEFSTFLKAEQNEKAELLEKLTGTESFSLISKKIYEKYAAAKSALEELSFLANGIQLLSEGDIAALKSELSEKEQLQMQLKGKNEHILLIYNRWIFLHEEEESLAKQRVSLEDLHQMVVSLQLECEKRHVSLAEIGERIRVHTEETERLNQLLKEVRSIDVLIEEAIAKTKELRDVHNLNCHKLQELATQKKRISDDLDENRKNWNISEKWITDHPEYKRIAEQYVLLSDLFEQLDEHEIKKKTFLKDLADAQSKRVSHLALLSEGKEVSVKQKKDLEDLSLSLSELSVQLKDTDISVVFDALQKREKEGVFLKNVLTLYTELHDAQKEYEEAISSLEGLKEIRECLLSRIEDRRVETEKARIYKEAQESLYQNYILSVSGKIEALRPLLTKGVPCPLCGSKEHPFASSDDLVHEMVKSAKEELNASKGRYDVLWNEYNNLLHSKVVLEEREKNLSHDIEKKGSLLKVLQQRWLQETDEITRSALDKDGLEGVSKQIEKNNAIVEGLKKQRDSFLDLSQKADVLQKRKSVLEERFQETERVISEHKGIIALLDQSILSFQSGIEEKDHKIAIVKEKISELIGGNWWLQKRANHTEHFRTELDRTVQEWNSHNQCLSDLEKKYEQLRGELLYCNRSLSDLEDRQRDSWERLKVSNEALSRLQEKRKNVFGDRIPDDEERKCKEKGVELQSSFSLLQKEYDSYSSKYRCAIGEERQFSRAVQEREKSAILLKEELLKEGTFETILDEKNKLEIQQKELLESISQISSKLFFNSEQEKRRKDLIKEREKRLAVFDSWGKLNELAGSSDGKKFRLIAQGYTLDLLLVDANLHLKELAPRYRLERIPDTLALQVRDHDMFDEIRSVHSLSGGESFLVSLALALGLSSLSSNRMRVESLFIDEGFGSLDGETLRTALEALENLRLQGRKIGVISHVPEMAERISTQIRVEKTSNGRSKIRIVG